MPDSSNPPQLDDVLNSVLAKAGIQPVYATHTTGVTAAAEQLDKVLGVSDQILDLPLEPIPGRPDIPTQAEAKALLAAIDGKGPLPPGWKAETHTGLTVATKPGSGLGVAETQDPDLAQAEIDVARHDRRERQAAMLREIARLDEELGVPPDQNLLLLADRLEGKRPAIGHFRCVFCTRPPEWVERLCDGLPLSGPNAGPAVEGVTKTAVVEIPLCERHYLRRLHFLYPAPIGDLTPMCFSKHQPTGGPPATPPQPALNPDPPF